MTRPESTVAGPALAAPLYDKVYPRSVTGRFNNWRWFFVWLTQIVFYGLCWVPWHGRQAVLFDLAARKIYLFDLVLWPQDTIYLVLFLILCALALFLFTAVAGRVWCGYSCPQTVYTEIFLWIERLVEGERPKRMKLDAAPWTARKLAIKSAKHALWALVALWTGISFVGYVVPIRELIDSIVHFAIGPWAAFWVLFYGFALYGNAGFLREQMCRQICPYARFQFAMFDPDTLIIAYDSARGDPRGSRSRNSDHRAQGLGHCVDCGICVQVCPTGIDIRNGLQNECIGCAACIDACDQVMDKMAYPRGLIRYATENAVTRADQRLNFWHLIRRPRVMIYSAIFMTILFGAIGSLATRSPFKVYITRDRTMLARTTADGSIENTFNLQIMNKDDHAHTFDISVDGLPDLQLAEKRPFTVRAGDVATLTETVLLSPGKGRRGANSIEFHIEDAADHALGDTEQTKFWVF